MLIVIVIIGILAGALIPRIWNARDKAQDVAIEANVNAIVSAGMQALLDWDNPCNDSGDVQYSTMTAYWMTDLWTGYKCKKVAGDHIVVWTSEMHIKDNNNCAESGTGSIGELSSNSTLNQVMSVVGGWTGVYCLAQ